MLFAYLPAHSAMPYCYQATSRVLIVQSTRPTGFHPLEVVAKTASGYKLQHLSLTTMTQVRRIQVTSCNQTE